MRKPANNRTTLFPLASISQGQTMEIVTIHAAKTTLSQLLARVEAGEEILLAHGKQPIAKLVPFPAARAPTQVWGA